MTQGRKAGTAPIRKGERGKHIARALIVGAWLPLFTGAALANVGDTVRAIGLGLAVAGLALQILAARRLIRLSTPSSAPREVPSTART